MNNDEHSGNTWGSEKVQLEELGRITRTSERIYPNAWGQQISTSGNSAEELDEAYEKK